MIYGNMLVEILFTWLRDSLAEGGSNTIQVHLTSIT